jgi:hypothetical protein
VERLDRVDHADLGPVVLDRGQDGVEVGLRQHGHVERLAGRVLQPLVAQADLRRRLLARDVQRRAPGADEVAHRHAGQRRLADPGRAAQQHQRARDETAAEDAVQLADAGGQARDMTRLDVAQGHGRRCRARATRPGAATTAPTRARGRRALLDERVPLAAARALAVPAGFGVAACGADVDGGWTGHLGGHRG